MGGKPKIKAPSPPPLLEPPRLASTAVQEAATATRRRFAAGSGLNSTILTSPLGVTQFADTTQKTLLGA